MEVQSTTATYGIMAEFDTPTELVEAARETYSAGYRKIDAFSPYPVEEAWEAIGVKKTLVPKIMLAGGLTGAVTGYMLQFLAAGVWYPMNIGGRPFHSWPSFIPVTFELTVLFASLSGVFGMIALNGLPKPYHPVFNVPAFAAASRDKFFLLIEARDPKFDTEKTREFLQRFNPREISDVDH